MYLMILNISINYTEDSLVQINGKLYKLKRNSFKRRKDKLQ